VITEDEARAVAVTEASQAYGDLTGYTVTARLADGNWHIDYELTDKMLLGGGPHFIISGETGEVLSRRYEQ
jgi:hypothetical protein